MKQSNAWFESLRIILALALAALGTQPRASQEAAGMNSFQVFFKLDPRLLGPTYGGERWLSSPSRTGAVASQLSGRLTQAWHQPISAHVVIGFGACR